MLLRHTQSSAGSTPRPPLSSNESSKMIRHINRISRFGKKRHLVPLCPYHREAQPVRERLHEGRRLEVFHRLEGVVGAQVPQGQLRIVGLVEPTATLEEEADT